MLIFPIPYLPFVFPAVVWFEWARFALAMSYPRVDS